VYLGSDANILPLEERHACAKLRSTVAGEKGGAMDLTPGEKAVLGQIRVLYATESRRDHQLKALRMQWPPIHHEAYQRAYGGLLAKLLIQDVDAQVFRITETGLGAIGVAVPRTQAQPQPRRVDERKSGPPVPPADTGKRQVGALSRLLGALRR
jgi:hypothetical protein